LACANCAMIRVPPQETGQTTFRLVRLFVFNILPALDFPLHLCARFVGRF
jgi:hypothetical protein